jgi:hypothetical protein
MSARDPPGIGHSVLPVGGQARSRDTNGLHRRHGPAEEAAGGWALDRILVVADAVLLETLRDRFAAAGAVEVVGADSSRAGLVRAALERPSLVVCHAQTLDVSVEALAAQLDKLRIDARILCVEASDDGRDGRVVGCSPERLFETVIECLPAAGVTSQRAQVNILAHLEHVSLTGGARPPCSANLLELALGSVLVEAPHALEVDDRLSIHFFLCTHGGQRSTGVSLTGTVQECVDPDAFHYETRVDHLDEASRCAIQAFLSEGRKSGSAKS